MGISFSQAPTGAKDVSSLRTGISFPHISEATRIQRLEPPTGALRMVLDTDTYNEVDDQFALVYAWLSAGRLALEAIYAAPFHNRRSAGAEDGMERSYEEILRLLGHLGVSPAGLAFKGARRFLSQETAPMANPAVDDLIARALATPADETLYVVAIAALTNVATAILLEPAIIERIVVVWLGGHALHWPHTREFNLTGDILAAQIVFDCGVPLVHVPCAGVTTHLSTTVAELERYVQGRGAIGDYLVDIVKGHSEDHFAWSKVIWDVAPIAYLIHPEWVTTVLTHTPILNREATWSLNPRRHLMRYATYVQRDPIFRDLFTKLAGQAG